MKTRSDLNRLLLVLTLALSLALAGCSDDDDPTAPGGNNNNNNNGDPTAEFAASMDAYVSSSSSTANFGGSAKLEVGSGKYAFLQFDLTGLPAQAVVTGFTLNLVQSAEGGANPVGDVTLTWTTVDDWVETELTWDNAPDVYDFLGNTSVEALGTGTRTLTIDNDIAPVTARQDVLYGNGLLSVRLSSEQDLTFLSSNVADPTQRPQLILEYVVGTEVDLTPVADTWTASYDGDTNYNDREYLVVDRGREDVYLKFDLSALPMGATVQHAALSAVAASGFAYGGDGNVYSSFVADDSWTETGLTYNNRPTASTERYGHWWLWYGYDPPEEKTGVNASEALLPVVRNEAGGDGMLSLRLHSPGYRTEYYPRENADPAKRPRLKILYTP